MAVKVFGLDVGGSDGNTRGRGSRAKGNRNSRSSRSSNSKRDPPSLSSGVAGLINEVLGGNESDGDDNGLIDVWFERKSGKGKKK